MASFVVTLRGPRARMPRHHAHNAARTVAAAGGASHSAQVIVRTLTARDAFAVGATRADGPPLAEHSRGSARPTTVDEVRPMS